MTSTQHRCVFVGNIPYDATEDQLIRICEEVGPVVSFRLVVDRDTGKPKGYGFCEFRDEETALSARRNLQGYEINGRQLRVDFAENEKGSVDRNREQGRGGPGLAQNIDVHKQTGGPRSVRDPSFDQPIGHAVAASAAAVMAGILGAPQVSTTLSQANMSINGQQSKGGVSGIAVGTDALTNHLAGMSRHRLFEILSQMKDLIQRNQRQARQILMANPQLTKALFQAQIMLGLLPQRMPLQNVAGQPQQQQLLQQPQVQQLHMQVSQAPAIQNLSQLAAVQQTPSQQGQLHMPTGQSQSQLQAAQQSQAMSVPLQSHQPAQNLEFQHSMQALQQSNPRTAKVLPFSQPAQLTGNNLGLRPQNPTVQHAQPQSSLNLPPLPQKPRPLVAPSQLQPQITQGGSLQPLSGSQSQNSQPPFQQSSGMSQTSASLLYQQIQPSHPNRPALQQGFQGGSSQVGRGPNMEAPSGSGPFTIWNEPLASSVSMVEASHTGVSMGQAAHIGPGQPLGATGLPLIAAPPSNNGSIPVQQGPIQSNAEHEGLVYSQGFSQPQAQSQSQQQTQQQPQMQVPIELEHQKALLQQVMNLTPEQISSLGPEQRQQVLQLQQAFRSQTT